MLRGDHPVGRCRDRVRRATNERASPYGYSLDAASLLAAFNASEDGHRVAIYHSTTQRGRAVADRHQPRRIPRVPPRDRLLGRRPRRAGRGGSPTGRSPRRKCTSDERAARLPHLCTALRPRRALLREVRNAPGVRRQRSRRRTRRLRARARAQDRPALHGRRARARGRRAQPGRGRVHPGHAARGGSAEHPAAQRGVRRARFPGGGTQGRDGAPGRSGGRAKEVLLEAEMATPGIGCR